MLVEYDPDHKIDLKFMLAEQKERNPRAKFTRSRTLGWFYETETIKGRIAQFRGGIVYVPRAKIRERVSPRTSLPNTESSRRKFIMLRSPLMPTAEDLFPS